MVPVGPGTAWAGGKHCHFPPDAEFPGMQREVVKSHRFSSTFQRKPGRPASHSAVAVLGSYPKWATVGL